MKLRKLELKDAPLMLEWMHDKSVVENLSANFGAKKIEDCEAFIEASKNDQANLNLAIVNDNDEYMGTASLKHIDKENQNAEFAIAMRTCAMGKGYSKYGMAVKRKDEQTNVSDTTMPRIAISLIQNRDEMSEELRILYVAMTRAKQKLILVSSHKKLLSDLKSAASKITDKAEILPFYHHRAGKLPARKALEFDEIT